MIKITNGSKTIADKKLLNDISFKLEKGQIVGLLGPNGCGKTSLIRTIVGDYSLNEGEIEVENFPTRQSRIEGIAYMPSESLFTNTFLLKLIDVFEATNDDFSKDRMMELMKKFSLPHFSKFSKLSKGQKKAFHLSLVLSRDCEYYVLDEPLNGIDPSYRKMIIDEILESINTEEKLIIISSHQLNEIDEILDTLLLMEEGSLEGIYDIDEIRVENNLYDWYIEKYRH